MFDLEKMSLEELKKLKEKIEKEIEKRSDKIILELYYNNYKGKTWIAKCDPKTKKILNFINPVSKQPRDNYSGKKIYEVPNVEGTILCIQEMKNRMYKIIKNGKLEDFK